MRKTITISPTATDTDGIVDGGTCTGAIELVMNGALVSGRDADGLVTTTTPTAAGTVAMTGALKSSATLTVFASERYITITSDGNDSGVTFTITGTNKEGHTIYDVVTGPNSVVATSAKKFLTVTNIYISGAGTGNITIGSAGIGTMTTPSAINILSGGDESDITFTVYGLDRQGRENSEAITGPDTTTVYGKVDWKYIHKITASATVGNAVDIGMANRCWSQWIPVDRYGGPISLSVTLSSGASMTYGIEHTLNDVQVAGAQEDDFDVFTHDSLTGEVASGDGTYTTPVAAVRLAITSFSSGTATLKVVQASN